MSASTRCFTARPFAQPTVVPDQAAIAHPVDHGGELRCRRWWMRRTLRRQPMSRRRGREPQSRQHPRSSEPRCARRRVLAQQRSCMKERVTTSSGSGSRAARRTSVGPRRALVAPYQQLSGAAKAGESTRSPRIRRSASRSPSDEQRSPLQRGGAPHLRNVARHLAASEVVEERVHHLRRASPRAPPVRRSRCPSSRDPKANIVSLVHRLSRETPIGRPLEHPASHRIHSYSSCCSPAPLRHSRSLDVAPPNSSHNTSLLPHPHPRTVVAVLR